MEKLAPTPDKRCGTTAGHRAHRKRNEVPCRECKDAINARHREVYDSELNKLWVYNYRIKANPNYEQDKADKAQRKIDAIAARAKAAEEKRAEVERRRAERRANSKEELQRQRVAKNKAAQAAKRAQEEEATALKKAEYEKKLQAWALKKEEKKRQLLLKKLYALMKKRQKALEVAEKIAQRIEKKERLRNQHGTAVGDYYRCKKTNGTACDSCKAVGAQYVREIFKSNPRYKEKEKEWKKKNPDKVCRPKNRGRLCGGKRRAYTRNQIIKRDGINCYLCNTPVDFNASHNMGQPGWELYPHVEHVIPLAKGGDDTLENVKLAHAICNMKKGVSLTAKA